MTSPEDIVKRLRDCDILLKLVALGDMRAVADLQTRTEQAAATITRLTSELSAEREARGKADAENDRMRDGLRAVRIFARLIESMEGDGTDSEFAEEVLQTHLPSILNVVTRALATDKDAG